MSPKQLGILGEKIAENYLKKKGYKVLDRNYVLRSVPGPQRGEIDIIAKKGDILSFIEVKTLTSPAACGGRAGFSPEDRVNFQKQRKIIKTAQSWLIKNKIPLDTEWQIDIVSIKINLSTKTAKVRHLPNVIS